MSKVLAIIGAGHLGQQIAHFAISDKHFGKVVFFDDFATGKSAGHSIIGKIEDVAQQFRQNAFDELVIAIGYNHLPLKKQLFEKLAEEVPFATIVHSSCWVDSTASIEKGTVVYPGCCIDANVVVGANTLLNLNCTISHDSTIGKHSFLSPRVAIAGFVAVGELCNIGINATIIDNISIVGETQLGAASVVIKNIGTKGLYVGNPARYIKKKPY